MSTYTSNFTLYNAFRKNMANGSFDLDADTFKWTLHGSLYVPNVATNAVYADLGAELATQYGYTNGGQTAANVVWTQSGASVKFDCDDPAWVANGGSLVACYAVLRRVGTMNSLVDALVGYATLNTAGGATVVTATDGNQLRVQLPAAGLFVLA
jgi:hypothetical protein